MQKEIKENSDQDDFGNFDDQEIQSVPEKPIKKFSTSDLGLKAKDPNKINGINDLYPNGNALKKELLYSVFGLEDLDSDDSKT